MIPPVKQRRRAFARPTQNDFRLLYVQIPSVDPTFLPSLLPPPWTRAQLPKHDYFLFGITSSGLIDHWSFLLSPRRIIRSTPPVLNERLMA